MDNAQPAPERAPMADDITNDALIERYLAGPDLVRDTVADMSADQLFARPIPDKMTTQEVVTHMVDSEVGLGARLKRAMAGEEPLASGAHPEAVSDPTRDVGAEIKMLGLARAQTAEALRQLAPEAWDNVALHRGERELNLRQLLMMMTRHLENHVTAIEEKRTALGL